jgi:hypothetical protein
MQEYRAHLLEIALIPLKMARSQELFRAQVQSKLTAVNYGHPVVPSPYPAAGTYSRQGGIIPARSKPFVVPKVRISEEHGLPWQKKGAYTKRTSRQPDFHSKHS